MNDNFNQLKSRWHSLDESLLPNFEDLQKEIEKIRRDQKKKIVRWYSMILIFSIITFGYVIYTDELNSIYKSISEFILLFVSLFHLYNSWTKIKIQNKDYLLNNIDFIETLGENQMWKAVKQLVINSISITLLSIAAFLFFLDKLLKSDSLFMLFLVMMLLFNGILWFFTKPKLQLKIKSDNEKIILKVDKFKKNLKN